MLVISKFAALKVIILASLITALTACVSNYTDRRAESEHFYNGQFNNKVMEEHSLWSFLYTRATTDWSSWPEWIDTAFGPKPREKTDDDVIVTMINHATVLIQSGGLNIITDPIYSLRASPFSFLGPKRVRKPGIKFEDLPKIDAILISHDHYDHLDLPTIKKLSQRDQSKVFVGLGVGQHLTSIANVQEFDWWQSTSLSEQMKITFVPVQHFSGRGLFDRFSTLWGGYVIETANKKIYFGGDSGYADHYKQTHEKFGAMDLAFLPIGAYAPRSFMGYAHMDPEQAIQAHLDLHSKQSIGIHYGTFQLTAEPINEPQELLLKEKAKANIEADKFITMEFGQPYILDQFQALLLAEDNRSTHKAQPVD